VLNVSSPSVIFGSSPQNPNGGGDAGGDFGQLDEMFKSMMQGAGTGGGDQVGK
jgi:hypothetical protein